MELTNRQECYEGEDAEAATTVMNFHEPIPMALKASEAAMEVSASQSRGPAALQAARAPQTTQSKVIVGRQDIDLTTLAHQEEVATPNELQVAEWIENLQHQH